MASSSLFGQAAGATNSTFGFGSNNASMTATQKPLESKPGGFAFGNTTTSTPQNVFGTNNTFGNAATSTASNVFGTNSAFGNAATNTASNVFGTNNTFGNAATSTAPNVFGTNNTFGNISTLGQQTNVGFGVPNTGFGGFGSKPAQTVPPAFGSSVIGFGTQNQQQQQQVSQLPQQNTQPPQGASIYSPKIYNDERDGIVAKFNIVQGLYGTGKAYSSPFSQPHEFTEKDILNRFKSIAYSELPPNNDDEKIFFLINITGDEAQLKTTLLQYEQNFKNIFGTQYTAKLEIRNVLPQKTALLSFGVTETATLKPVEESQLRSYFSQLNAKQQLNSIFAGAFVEVLFNSVSSQELNAYLSAPPSGIDERLWLQAKAENPDSSRFTPVPLIGFKSLNNRFKMQSSQIEQQKMRLKKCVEQIKALDNDTIRMKAKFEDCRRKHLKLKNMVLEKMIKLHVLRNMNLPIQPEEDKMRAMIESIQSELYAPNKFQGCLQEIMSFMRQMPFETPRMKTFIRDSSIINDYKQVLVDENRGIMNLVDILQKDLDDIQRLGGRVAPAE